MSQEIQLYRSLSSHIDPIVQIERMGKMFAKSGMFGCERPEQGEVLAMICVAENKSPVEITRTYHIVEGKLSKKALAQLAEFRAKGGKHRWLRSGDEPAANEADRKAEGEFTFEGVTVKYGYSLADAKTECVLRPNSRWTKRPGNMLRARCITNALGMLCPEIVAGEDNDGGAAMDIAPAPSLDLKVAKPEAVTVEAEIVHPKAGDPGFKPAIVPKSEDKDDVKELAKVGLAPVQPAEKPVSTPAKFTAAADASGLTNEALAALTTAVGDTKLKAVVAWLLAATWVKPTTSGEGDLSTLSVARAQKIIDNPAGFLAHAKIQ